jgi:flavin-dependent thymidylate synthase
MDYRRKVQRLQTQRLNGKVKKSSAGSNPASRSQAYHGSIARCFYIGLFLKLSIMNKVELIGFYGSDTVHALSAWTSTSRHLTHEKEARIPDLLSMLAREGHHTPFEKSSLHFLVTCDQASHIHLLKHRISVSINGESGRYKELKEDKLYLPEDWDIDIKGFYEEVSGCEYPSGQTWLQVLEGYTKLGNSLYHKSLEELTPILGRKRAKESARFFKTMNSQITMDVMFNWRSFAHFQGLRNSVHAQVEIRDIAAEMLRLVKELEVFEHTIKAFNL